LQVLTNLSSDSVSQFTLYGHIKKGNKPDFHAAADVETARRLYDRFVQKVSDLYKAERVKNGVFQAMMEVELKNDGPVGVDFRSEDGAVGQSRVLLPIRLFILSRHSLIDCLGHY
jgi:D-tyrosyl-tRNA(Tyr) deacylase